MLQKIRRIVTGHNANGKSFIAMDGPSPHALAVLNEPAFGLTDLWVTNSTPANNIGDEDPAARKLVLEPPANGSIFRVVEFPPDLQTIGKVDVEAAFKAIGGEHTLDRTNPQKPGMHKTNSVDYAIVISGEIYAIMDEGETLMKAGDCLIQRGTNHAWSNRSNAPCLVAFILINAAPV
ncbi:MAG: cupin domain-containing protein [Candidatus Obscuribacterales bacterium]|nr:cupin domain-containing protein [Candidatus Obscuribacterales bacterium]